MSAELDRLTAAVTQNTSVDQSAITLLNGLAQQLKDMVNSSTELNDLKSKVNDLATTLEADNQAVAAAITANTPSA